MVIIATSISTATNQSHDLITELDIGFFSC